MAEVSSWNCPQMNVTGPCWWLVHIAIGSVNGLVPSMCQRPHNTDLLLDGTKPLPEPMLTKFWCHTVSPGTNVSKTTQNWLVAWWHQAITWTNADQILMSYSITGDQCCKDHTKLDCCLMAPSHYLNQCWSKFDVIEYHRGLMCQRQDKNKHHNNSFVQEYSNSITNAFKLKFVLSHRCRKDILVYERQCIETVHRKTF